MIKPLFAVIFLSPLLVAFSYPQTPRQQVTIEKFDKTVADPYRHFEDKHSSFTETWLEKQRTFTNSYIFDEQGVGLESEIIRQLEELSQFISYSQLVISSSGYYAIKYDGSRKFSTLVFFPNFIMENEIELFDPATYDPSLNTSIQTIALSSDEKFLSINIAIKGRDSRSVLFLSTSQNTLIPYSAPSVYISQHAWSEHGSVFSYVETSERKQISIDLADLSTPVTAPTVEYSQIKESSNLIDVFRRRDENQRNSFKILFAGQEIHIDSPEGTYAYHLATDESGVYFQVYEANSVTQSSFRHSVKFYAVNSPGQHTGYESLRTVLDLPSINSFKNVILNGDFIYVAPTGFRNNSTLKIYNLTGDLQFSEQLSNDGNISFTQHRANAKAPIIAIRHSNRPSEHFIYDSSENKLSPLFNNSYPSQFNQIEVTRLTVPNGDIQVPVTLLRRKDSNPNVPHPTFLYGYGGFRVGVGPHMDLQQMFFALNHGYVAIAHIRGGNEFGPQWHADGALTNKQNVFDDFIAVAQWLNDEGLTSPEQLAISGTSNGGLLAAAVGLQAPELIKLSVVNVGVLDMLRYHVMDKMWMSEFGSPDEEIHFNNLLTYSPYHNVEKGIQYPTFYVTVGENDTRVHPGHSYKFLAQLQYQSTSENPALLSSAKNIGHSYRAKNRTLLQKDLLRLWTLVAKEVGLFEFADSSDARQEQP